MFCNKNKLNWDDFDGLRELVKSFVKEKRYIHTLGVEREAVKIAEIYDCGEEFIKKMRSAAILHDITKEFNKEKQLEVCEKYQIKLSKEDMKVEKEWHAKTAAYIAKYEFGADDIIFNSVYNHTFGVGYNSDLANKIIYLADYIEPNRVFQDCVDIREYFYSRLENKENIQEKYKVLNETMLFSLGKIIKSVVDDNLYMHKNTIKCRNALINKKIMV